MGGGRLGSKAPPSGRGRRWSVCADAQANLSLAGRTCSHGGNNVPWLIYKVLRNEKYISYNVSTSYEDHQMLQQAMWLFMDLLSTQQSNLTWKKKSEIRIRWKYRKKTRKEKKTEKKRRSGLIMSVHTAQWKNATSSTIQANINRYICSVFKRFVLNCQNMVILSKCCFCQNVVSVCFSFFSCFFIFFSTVYHFVTSRKHAYIILTPLNPTFI